MESHTPKMTPDPVPVAWQARWVLPIDRSPLAGGIVTVANGRIVAVGENLSGRPPRDLGDVVLLPGLVNAHTHLEFSGLDAPLGEPGLEFSRWIGRVVEWRRNLAAELGDQPEALAAHRRQAVERGLAESQAAGVVALGEIATPGWPRECYEQVDAPETASFLELLGASPERTEPLLALASKHVQSLKKVGGGVHAGLSPHAPYTITLELLRSACDLSAREQIPVAMHLAESQAELELLASHCGPLALRLQSLNAWFPGSAPRGIRPLDYLEMLSRAHRSLVIHGNYLLPDEWQQLAANRERMSLVYCPRTHAYFGHSRYPLAEMLAAGVHLAVGTDSRASNPDLRLWEELRHIAASHPDVSPETILKLGTLYGAEALGLEAHYGSLAPGKSDHLAIVPIEPGCDDPYQAVFASAAGATLLMR